MSLRPQSPAHPASAMPAAILAGLLVPLAVLASPMNFGTENGRPVSARWPDNTTIHVYIPTPPDPPGACAIADAKAGMQRWALALAARGITIQFHENQPRPVPAVNAVGVEWVPDGSLPNDNQGEGGCNASPRGAGYVIDDGYIKVETDEPCGDDMANTFMHEFGHVLGLADEATLPGQPHNAMDHDMPVESGPMTFSPRDSAELRSLYGCFATQPPALPAGGLVFSVLPVGSPPSFLYEYTVEWYAGPGIPAFDVTLGGPRGSVTVLSMPPGWQVATPPFYLDGPPSPAVTEDTRELHFFAVGDDIGPALPVGTFLLQSSAPPVPGWGLPLIDPNEDGLFEPLPVMVPGDPVSGVPAPGPSRPGLRWLVPRPNPFRDATRLRFTSTFAWTDGRADVFDVHGRLVRSLALDEGGSGEGGVAWDGRTETGEPAGAGAYFVRVTLDGASVMGSVLRIR